MQQLVRAAEDPVPGDRAVRPERPAVDVIELELVGGPADPAVLERPGAAAAVPLPYAAPDVGGDVAAAFGGMRGSLGGRLGPGGSRRGRVGLPRLRPDPAALAVPLDDEIEADLEDVGVARVRMRVRERIPRRGDLLDQPSRHRDVDAAQLRGLRLDDGRRRQPETLALLGLCARVGTYLVGQPTRRIVK
jgi:hypothetical protein